MTQHKTVASHIPSSDPPARWRQNHPLPAVQTAWPATSEWWPWRVVKGCPSASCGASRPARPQTWPPRRPAPSGWGARRRDLHSRQRGVPYRCAGSSPQSNWTITCSWQNSTILIQFSSSDKNMTINLSSLMIKFSLFLLPMWVEHHLS